LEVVRYDAEHSEKDERRLGRNLVPSDAAWR
jgi:hypothetical protein